MTTPTPTPGGEFQKARSLLAEVAERGTGFLPHECHLAVLHACDDLETAANTAWPPPDPPTGIPDLRSSLLEADICLHTVATDPSRHQVDPLRLALAIDHLTTAIHHLPAPDSGHSPR